MERLAGVVDRTGLLPWMARLQPGRLVVLCYHRIRPDDDGFSTAFDPGVFGPTAGEFEEQLVWLRDHARVVGEPGLVELARSTAVPRDPCVAVTFDDGYRDNFTLARPVLERLGVPAIFFIPTSLVERREVGWWDVAAYLIWRTRRPAITFEGRALSVGEDRSRLVRWIQKRIQGREAALVPTLLAELSAACDVAPPDASLQDAQLMTWEQIREMARGGLVSIGSHAQTHRALSMMSLDEQRRELVDSKRILEAKTGRPVRTLAYPHGRSADFTCETERLAREAGYELAFAFDSDRPGCSRIGALRPHRINRLEAPASMEMLRASTLAPEVFTRRRTCAVPFVVLGASATALALGRRIRDAGASAVLVDTDDEAGGIATSSRVWSARHRIPRGPEALRLLGRLAAAQDGLTKPLLLGTGDDDLWFLAEHRAELDAAFDVLHPRNEALVACLDKARFLRFCDEHGVPVPSWFVCRADPESLRQAVTADKLPLVARFASRAHGGREFPKMFRLDTPVDVDALVETAARALRPTDELVFSESLLHRDLVRYSVAFCRARHTCLAFEAIKERPAATTGNVGTYVTLADAPDARAIALRVVEALDYHGMGEMEIFHDRSADRYYAIEINARPWLQLAMEPLAGTDFVGFLAGQGEGSSGEPRIGAAWIDVLNDVFWRYSRTGRRAADGEVTAAYLPSLARVRAFKLFAPTDPGPALVEAAHWLRDTVGRRTARRG